MNTDIPASEQTGESPDFTDEDFKRLIAPRPMALYVVPSVIRGWATSVWASSAAEARAIAQEQEKKYR